MEDLLRKGYSGGEELRRAMAALAGPSNAKEADKVAMKEAVASGPQPVPLPIQIAEDTDLSTRELAYAAQKYGRAARRYPSDFQAAYNHGLALQELALRSSSSWLDQLHLLQQAAEQYEAAWKLRQDSHAALYNWGVALSDMARVTKQTDKDQSKRYLEESASKYSSSLKWNPNNPQALNNWALVLQELSTMRPPAQQATLVWESIAKFRKAIRLRPDFDRACYNLGTVIYAYACTQQSSLTQQLPASRLSQDPDRIKTERISETAVSCHFAVAAQYIILAHALQPGKEVYRKSLHVIQPLLPLPHLKAGHLKVAVPGTEHTSHERWEDRWFVLDESSFRSQQQVGGEDEEQEAGTSGTAHSISWKDVAATRTCLDPSLPDGYAFWLGLNSQPSGIYFVAEVADDAEGWVDALELCAHVANLRQLPALREALNPPRATEKQRVKKTTPSGRRLREK